MAEETSLIEGAMKAARAIHDYAATKDWKKQDYHIFMTINTDLIVLRITVVAKAFDGRSEAKEYEDYDDVMDCIDKALRSLNIFNYYGLVLSGMNEYGYYQRPLGESDIEVDEKLINNSESWKRPSPSKRSVKRATS